MNAEAPAGVRSRAPRAAPGSLPPAARILQHSLGNAGTGEALRGGFAEQAAERSAAKAMKNDVALPGSAVPRGGSPLGPEVRSHFESRLGADFGAVNVHTGQTGDSLAFAQGENIVFAPGRFAPETHDGRRLLAHELTHVVQQRASGPRVQHQKAETEAQRVAHLNAAYRDAVNGNNWPRAAELLNTYNDQDIAARIARLSHTQRIHLYAGARKSLPDFHRRVTDAIMAADPEARRVGELKFDYNSAVERGDWPSAARTLGEFNDIDVRLMLNALPLVSLPEIRKGAVTTQGAGSGRLTAAVDDVRHTRVLNAALERIRHIGVPLTTQAKADEVSAATQDVDLANPADLGTVATAISAAFPSEAGAILGIVLARVDRPSPRTEPTAEEQAALEARMRLLQVQPRGPWKQYGPGVVAPVLAQMAGRPVLELLEAIENAFSGAGAFIAGVIEGLSSSMNEAQRKELAHKLLQSQILTAAFPPIFLVLLCYKT